MAFAKQNSYYAIFTFQIVIYRNKNMSDNIAYSGLIEHNLFMQKYTKIWIGA